MNLGDCIFCLHITHEKLFVNILLSLKWQTTAWSICFLHLSLTSIFTRRGIGCATGFGTRCSDFGCGIARVRIPVAKAPPLQQVAATAMFSWERAAV